MHQECFRCLINIEIYSRSIFEAPQESTRATSLVSQGHPIRFSGAGAPQEFPRKPITFNFSSILSL